MMSFVLQALNAIIGEQVVTKGKTTDDGMLTFTGQLHLTNVQDVDQGLYQCFVTNDHDTVFSQKAHLTVNGRLSF